MQGVTIAIWILVAATFAATCILGQLAGCVGVLGAGLISLALHKRTAMDGESLPSSNLRQFVPWIVCILLFGFFVLVFAPFADLPAVVMALLVLSPLFGTMVFIASSAICGLTRRCS